MYLSNAEKEALFLTGYGDVPPWAVQQGLEQALARGAYVPGEDAMRIRLADALDLEERLATAGGKTTEQQAEEAQRAEDEAFANGFQQGLVEGIEASQEAAATEGATTEGQEAAEEPPTAPWRSPLEIVTEGAEEPEQEPPGGEDAAPAAVTQRIEDRDFSSFTKAQLLTFAADHFGVQLKLADSKDELIAQVQQLVNEANERVV